MSCGIYKITNQLNNKVYVGQSVNIEARWGEHIRNSVNCQSPSYHYPLYVDIRKYKLENFSFDIIEKCSIENLNQRECYWIDFYESFPVSLGKGYNQKPGGQGFSIRLSNWLDTITNELLDTKLSQREIASKFYLSIELIQGINTGRYWFREDIKYPIRDFYIKEVKNKFGELERKIIKTRKKQIALFCKLCGNPISQFSSSGLCRNCSDNLKYRLIPEDFKEKVLQLKTKQAIGEYYKVGLIVINRWLSEANVNLKDLNIDLRKKENLKNHHKKIGCFLNIDDVNPVGVYKGYAEASRALGLTCPVSIKNACIDNKLYHNYYWKFLEQ